MNRQFSTQRHQCGYCGSNLALPVATPGAACESFLYRNSLGGGLFAWMDASFPFPARVATLAPEDPLLRWLLAEIADPVYSGPLDPWPNCHSCGSHAFEPAAEPDTKVEWIREATFDQASRLSDEELLAELARIRRALHHSPPSPHFLDGSSAPSVRTLAEFSEVEIRDLADATLREEWLGPDGVELRRDHHLPKLLEALEFQSNLVVSADLHPGLADSYAFVSIAESDEPFSRRWLSGKRAHGRSFVALRGTSLVVSKFLPIACTVNVFSAMTRSSPPYRLAPVEPRLYGLCAQLEEAIAKAGIRLGGIQEFATWLPFEIPGWDSNIGSGRVFDLLFWDID